MLTDIFATRYIAAKLWTTFGEFERRLLVQGFRLLEEQICPYYYEGKEDPKSKKFWTTLNKRLSMELGLTTLSPVAYSYQSTWMGKPHAMSGVWPAIKICENWVLAPFNGADADRHIKERLSLVELGFRMRGEEISAANSSLAARIAAARIRVPLLTGARIPGDVGDRMTADSDRINKQYQDTVTELNARLRAAGCQLHYHNGFIQRTSDQVSTDHIEAPFWSVVAGSRWANVDIDMKEALDRRDSAGRDPAFYAVRALESTIKIVSDQKGWTRGTERGAHNYIENLAAKKAGFLSTWEADLIKALFTHVRNPLGHGPGSQSMPTLTPEQTDWAIETAMVWIKTIVRRSTL